MIKSFLILSLVGTWLGSAVADPLPLPLADVGIEEHLGNSVDKNLRFTDENGKTVKVGDYLDQGKPVLLNFAYFHCPMLCGLVQSGMITGLKKLPWLPGREYNLVTVSMDSREGPQQALEAKQRKLVEWKAEAGPGWAFLTGERKSVEQLTGSVGFKYNYLPAQNEFAHGAGLIFLTPSGKVSRYLYGVEFNPRDLRLALLDASEGRSLSLGDKIEMFCYRYDANQKGYVLFASNVMKGGGVVIIGLLGLLLIPLWRQELRRQGNSVATTEKIG